MCDSANPSQAKLRTSLCWNEVEPSTTGGSLRCQAYGTCNARQLPAELGQWVLAGAAIAQAPWWDQHRARLCQASLGAWEGPPGLNTEQPHWWAIQTKPRACLPFPGSGTTHGGERDHIKWPQMAFWPVSADEGLTKKYFLHLEGNGLLIPTQYQRSESSAVQWFCNRTSMTVLCIMSKDIFTSKSLNLSICNTLTWDIYICMICLIYHIYCTLYKHYV